MPDTVTFNDDQWDRDAYSYWYPDTGPIRVYFMRHFFPMFHDVPDEASAVAFVGFLYAEAWDGEDWRTFGAMEHVIDTRTGEDISDRVYEQSL